MRYLAALGIASLLLFLAFWGGAIVVRLVAGPHLTQNEFTVGRKLDLCGYAVDIRHEISGYDLDEWRGEGRCERLSELDRCVLGCLEAAGTIEIGARCWDDCLAR
ncbi:MAG: hypothetical protein H6748_07260 [Spirochaetaceae bacterium]|nr:hypothetical protein [Myxococcales bacterium]MCB9723824.1 hypothetical protein [Spirochaetaceae bacterium]HPG24009.1 hypothetical protein [Myxococcota bacterium]